MRLVRKCLALKERLRSRKPAFGAWISFADPAAAEIMTGSGFDWLLIDMEHTPLTLENLGHILMAFEGQPTVPLVRVPRGDPVIIKQVLDLGAGGILVPHVGTPEAARAAVAACRYPPAGTRGFGPRRASAYYALQDEYVRLANDAILVLIQIEHADAVKMVDDILAVPGIDVVLLGPMDLSGSLGVLGQLDHPSVVEAIDMVVAAAHRRSLPAGIPVDAPPEKLVRWATRGCTFVVTGEDHSLLRRAALETLSEIRMAIEAGQG